MGGGYGDDSKLSPFRYSPFIPRVGEARKEINAGKHVFRPFGIVSLKFS